MPTSSYWFVRRPADACHQHPFVVFDLNDQLSIPLTYFAKAASERLAETTVKSYLYALVRYHTWLALDDHESSGGRHWNSAPSTVRACVSDYLLQVFRCQVRPKGSHQQLIFLTQKNHSAVSILLAALRQYYSILYELGQYLYPNPLVDDAAGSPHTLSPCHDRAALPHMPRASGVSTSARGFTRLTDNYFLLVNEQWQPQIIDDPQFPQLIFRGGRQVGWHLREIVVTRMLFETGARISEICGLTLADWLDRRCEQEANAFNKGSRGRRVKFVRWSTTTAKLLRRYLDNERSQADRYGWGLQQHQRAALSGQIDLKHVPLFLTARRNRLSPDTFRAVSWKSACAAANLQATIHQTRHWYVTSAIRQIYETTPTEVDRQRRLRDLIEYMGWKQGEKTLDAYQHYFDAHRHAELQDQLHRRFDQTLQHLNRSPSPWLQAQNSAVVDPPSITLPDDPELEFLHRLGGET